MAIDPFMMRLRIIALVEKVEPMRLNVVIGPTRLGVFGGGGPFPYVRLSHTLYVKVRHLFSIRIVCMSD